MDQPDFFSTPDTATATIEPPAPILGRANTPPQAWLHVRSQLTDVDFLCLKLGDFYELYQDEAQLAAPLLGVALTKRNGIPMCGFPVHAADSYLRKLVAAGHRVATADNATVERVLCPPTPAAASVEPAAGSALSFPKQLRAVKAAGEDYEWYPTTDEIIAALVKHIKFTQVEHYRRGGSFLDIGAGNGKVITAVDKLEQITRTFAIEKSNTHLGNLPPEVFILGVDFWKTSLMDKELTFIFSNPPYSNFVEWSAKILREAPFETTVYLVIPERWEKNAILQQILKERGCTHKIIGRYDFEDAEERSARAKVHLLHIDIGKQWSNRHDVKEDPFTAFFNQTFTFPEAEEEEEKQTFEQRVEHTQVVNRLNFIEALCLLYEARMAELQRNYSAVCAIQPDILKEFEISKHGLIASLKMKLATCKKEYWRRLFDGMAEISNRLTKESRDTIARLMNDSTGIDFNRENAYAVVLWVVKNANTYFDSQFIATYERMVDYANIDNYVSNQRVFKQERFRYERHNDKQHTHYRLKVGHRMVLQWCGGLHRGYSASSTGLCSTAASFLGDILTICRNLGFDVIDPAPKENEWDDSEAHVFRFRKDGKVESLFRVRAFFNRNLHIQFHPDVIHAMNCLHGKLKGWLRDDAEAATELEIPQEIAAKHFHAPAFRLTGDTLQLMALPPAA